jgi:gliding motility-associated-like protein
VDLDQIRITNKLIKKSRFYIFLVLIFPLFLFGQGENYIWVGGSGNWSDSLNWYSESGGVPGIEDNVIFNGNSFTSKYQTVTINVQAYCHDMTWYNTTFEPKLAGNAALEIAGSLTLASDMIIDFTGQITFTAASPNHFILTNGRILKSNIIFDGDGSWNISDMLHTPLKNISLNKGVLNSSGNPISCGSFQSLTSNNRAFNFSGSNININGMNGSWKVNNQIDIVADNSTIRFENDNMLSVTTFDGGSKNYGNVVFMNDAVVSGSNSFGDVFFNAAHNYLLPGGDTQTFNGNIIARGCSGLISLSGSGNGQAKIAKTNGDINVSFVRFNSILSLLTGSNEFNAYRSVDGGNNEGINIFTDSRDLYWINGTGFWSDTIHWSSSPNNMDADCVPVDYDNVFFNDYSFIGSDSVKVDIKKLSCNNITWTGIDSPVFISTVPVEGITIYGSLEFSPLMNNKYMGPVFFADTLGEKTIKTSDKLFNGDIFFNGENGGWSITDSLKVDGIVTFFKGNLNTNDYNISCRALRSDSAFIRTLNLGASEIVITHNISPNTWSLNNENLELNSGTSLIDLKAPGSSFYNFGGDTIVFNNVLFSSDAVTAKLFTNSDTYAKFHKVTFRSNGSIMSSNAFDTLSFSPGNYYDLSPGATQTINHEIFPTGDCQGPILVKSAINGSQANIRKANDTIRISNTAIRDISAIGGAYYMAENSVDLGNNDGWDTIMVTAPGKLYWVGGSGDWSNKSHWSLSSGGPGGECIPTPYDTVIFDQHSYGNLDEFTSINLNNAFAHNMDWSAAGFMPELKSPRNEAYLRIYGSLKLNPEMEFTFPGYISFESSNKGETIITENIKFHNINNNVYFDGIGGEWTLMDSLQLGYSTTNRNNIHYLNGDLKTNNQYLDCYGFYATLPSQRNLFLENSDLHINYEWNVDGTNLNLLPNQSLIEVDSGFFVHKNGNGNPYHIVHFNAVNNPQYLFSEGADSLMFSEIIFHSKEGKIYGNSGSVYSDFIEFKGTGQVNQTANSNVNIYVVDSLLFNSTGKIFGNDTVRKYVRFNSTGEITGNGSYQNAFFNNDGKIVGNNIFDTITFNPPYTYQLGSQNKQTINDQFNIAGNNCEFIKLKATSTALAEVYKETGSVYGDFIEMTKIKAMGDAIFDAGQFSKDINNSNEGWLFYDQTLNYSLGPDTSILEGETIYICTENFNGNSATTYEWRNCVTGDILSTDSCLLVTERGYYCLTVFYDEGPGCTKQDTIFVGCYLDLLFNTDNATCNGFTNGAIEMEIVIGVGPFDINWYSDGNWIGNTQNIDNLSAGYYYYTIEDSQGCISGDTIKIKEPLPLEMTYDWKDACFEVDNGEIALEVSGGTEPYSYNWSNGAALPQLTGLSPGTYSVSVSDEHACPSIDSDILISELEKINFQITGSDLLCYQDGTGEIEVVNFSGGTGNYTTFEWLKNGQEYSESPDVSNLQAGTYSFTVMDDNGCTATDSIVISEPAPIILELVGTNGTTTLGSIDLTATGGISPYTFLWNTGAITEDIDPLGGGLYYVDVTDGNLCKSSDSIFIEVHFRVYAPTAFSPNNDELNDEFVIYGLGTDLRDFNLRIFNRYGQTVFETTDPNIHWNGKLYNTGQELPIEVYTWIIELNYIGGEKIIDKGNVTLLK